MKILGKMAGPVYLTKAKSPRVSESCAGCTLATCRSRSTFRTISPRSLSLRARILRAVLEDALVQAYRENRISGDQLMRALGIETRYELDGFLKARQVWTEYSLPELEADRATMERILSEKSRKRV